MRILIVSQYFWPESFRINDLALGLRDKGHRVTVLTGKPNYPEGHFFHSYGFFKRSREYYGGVEVIRVPLLPRGRGGGLRLALNYLSFALFASAIAPFQCRGHFDVIFVFEPSPITVGLPALLFKKIKNAPVMFWVQDLWPESLSATGAVRSTWLLKLIEVLVNFIYQRCDRILIQSKAFSQSLKKHGADPHRILYFPNSAEDLYKPVALSEDAPERACMPAGFRIMFAGNIGSSQDFLTILDAAEKLKGFPDIHWIIIGDGRMRPWVEAQIEKRGLNETFHLIGRHPVELMPRYFSLADVMLVTLKKEYIFSLTIPAKVQSYLACAKPIVAALDGEGARIVEEAGAGITCPAESPVALSEAVLAMYHMPDSARKVMGLKGRSYFEEHFERTMLLDRLDSWIKELGKGK